MRFVLDGHVYEGPSPAGEAGLKLNAQAWTLMNALGFGDITLDMDQIRRMIALQRALSATQAAHPLWDASFVGWTRNGHPLTFATSAALYADAKPIERWSAMVKVWMDAGFFDLVFPGDADDETSNTSPSTK